MIGLGDSWACPKPCGVMQLCRVGCATHVPLAPQGCMVSCPALAHHTRDDDGWWADEHLGSLVVTDSIRFPVRTEQMAEDRQPKAEGSSRTLRILVAHDGLFARELVTELLTRVGIPCRPSPAS
jgi:hypothetical protein